MKVVVSACLLGENCKYSGGNNLCAKLVAELGECQEIEVVPVCPEVAGGLPTPRPPAEIVDGCVVNSRGDDVTNAFRSGVDAEMARLSSEIDTGEIACAVLQSRSPSCGVKQVYDGTFSGRLVDGQGLFAQALREAGVRVVDVEDFQNMDLRVSLICG